ncbi:SGNH/GDSL hydrolase family protein [Paraglaciecola sp.]|uniref:SGNH/GDSL hydrolase family protein n=1 Tax=Paraglaciecola sp. TaxID=1920173 RepID=UPI003EF166A7
MKFRDLILTSRYILLCVFGVAGLSFVLTTAANANVDEQSNAAPNFTKGDVMVFIGDSITHGGSYHKDIFLFHATRYPNKPFKYYNAGISGDTAHGTLKRLEQDVLLHNPTKASIMLGMNDVGSWLYANQANTKQEKLDQAKQQKTIRDKYLHNMRSLVENLKSKNVDVTILTPSIYDQTAKVKVFNNVGRNDELAVYGQALKTMAPKYNAGIVDFQTPLLNINHKWQFKDPSASIIGEDRVHPGEQGHFVMAYSYLKAQGLAQNKVADFQFNVGDPNNYKMDNCEQDGDLVVSQTSLSFYCKPLSLPYPLNSEQAALSADISFQKEMNKMPFKVSGLKVGYYKLSIDGTVVGEYSHKQLLGGLDLSANKLTPMYQQALNVKQLNDQRAKTSGNIRNIQHVRFTMLSKYPETDLSNETIVKQVLSKHLDKSIGKPWHSYLKGVVASYFEFVKDEQKLRKEVDALFSQIYQVNQTKTLHWKLEKI